MRTYKKKKVKLEEFNLLIPLNEIADLAIGNEKPEDIGYGERSSLPDHLAYFSINPSSLLAAKAASKKYNEFVDKVLILKEKIRIAKRRLELKNKNI